MTDSNRWLEELPADEREVLEAGVGAAAPAGAKQAVWSAMAGKLPALAAGTAAAGGITALSTLKPFAVGLGLGAAVATGAAGYRVVTSDRGPVPAAPSAMSPHTVAPRPGARVAEQSGAAAREQRGAPVAPRASSRSEVHPLPVPEPARAPLPRTPPVASFAAEAPAPPAEEGVVVESRRVALARAALRAGDARAVLAELDALDVSFPRGQLLQEREGLRIEALLSRGETARARELARRFLARYPTSAHAPAIERALR